MGVRIIAFRSARPALVVKFCLKFVEITVLKTMAVVLIVHQNSSGDFKRKRS